MNPFKKHKSHAFGKDIYFLGCDSDGINYWLEEASWDCDWYWGFGYIEAYTNNNNPSRSRDIRSHEHFDGLNRYKNQNLYDAFKEKFVRSPLTNNELWQLCELMKSFYIAQEYAAFLQRGGAHFTENPCKSVIQDYAGADHINSVIIPAICQKVYNLLDPDFVDENKDKEVTK